MRGALAFLVAAVGVIAAAPAAAAVPIVHRARPGDTVETLAAAYYGNHAMAALLADVNHVGRGKPIPAGKAVKIPTATGYRTRAGDTFESLAKRLLGDARRAPYLASWNKLAPGDRLAPGTTLLVPFVLLHKSAAPESMTALARTYYGDPTKARLLGGYNFRGAPVLGAGERIAVPFPSLRVRRVRLAAASAGPHAGAAAAKSAPADDAARSEAEVAARVAARLALAQKAFSEGNYAEVPPSLTKLLSEDDPSEAQLVEIHRLLAFAYVALGADDVAVQEFREVLARAPDLTLDVATVSPKIRAAFERARKP